MLTATKQTIRVYIHTAHRKTACCAAHLFPTFGIEWELEGGDSELAMKTYQLPQLQ